MTDLDYTQLGTLIAAIAAVLVGFRNSRKADAAREKAVTAAEAAAAAKFAAEASQKEVIATKDGVFEVGKQIDGRLSELLKLTEQAAYAAGKLAGQLDQDRDRADRDDTDPPDTAQDQR
jgi:hypothetical protein